MITEEQAMRAATIYADDARHFRDVGSPILMRTKGLGLLACEAAVFSACQGRERALEVVNRRVGGVDERDVLHPRAPR